MSLFHLIEGCLLSATSRVGNAHEKRVNRLTSLGTRRSTKVLAIGSAMIDTIAIIGSARIERMTMLNADSSFLLLEEGRGMDVAVLAKFR